MALWREALLAWTVLQGEARGYTRHSQLERFRDCAEPCLVINMYLAGVHVEATARGGHFDANKIGSVQPVPSLDVNVGQLAYEWSHLETRPLTRSPVWWKQWRGVRVPECHPLFQRRPGPMAARERVCGAWMPSGVPRGLR